MFTADFDPDEESIDDNEIDREDLEECVMEQILQDIGVGLIAEVLASLGKLNQDSLLEFLPLNHPMWQGRRHKANTENVFLMPPYMIPSVDLTVCSQFLWSHN